MSARQIYYFDLFLAGFEIGLFSTELISTVLQPSQQAREDAECLSSAGGRLQQSILAVVKRIENLRGKIATVLMSSFCTL